jgi:FkbM family methyltransferase
MEANHFLLPNGKVVYCDRPDKAHAEAAIQDFYQLFYPIIGGKSMWAMDIGTSCGDSTVVMANCLNKGSKIIAFEPSREILPLLKRNLSHNLNCEYDLFNVAASDKDESMDFVYGVDNGGLLPPEPIALRGPCIPSYKVQCVNTYDTLTTIYSQFDLAKIQFIKIDTEGYDYVVLKSLAPLILKNKMPIILEWWNDEDNSNRMFREINSLQYQAVNTFGERVTEADFYTPKRTQDIIIKPI